MFSSPHSAAAALAVTPLSCSLLFNSDMPSEYNTRDTDISHVLEENVRIPQQKQTLLLFFPFKEPDHVSFVRKQLLQFSLVIVHPFAHTSPSNSINIYKIFASLGKRVNGSWTYAADLR